MSQEPWLSQNSMVSKAADLFIRLKRFLPLLLSHPLLPASLSDNCKMQFLSEVGHGARAGAFLLLACCNYHEDGSDDSNTCGVCAKKKKKLMPVA